MRTSTKKNTLFLLLLTAAACPATAQVAIYTGSLPGAAFAHNEQGRTPTVSSTILSMPPLHTLSIADGPLPPFRSYAPSSLMLPALLLVQVPPQTLSLQVLPAATTLAPPSYARPTSVATTPAVPSPGAVPLLLLAAAVGFPRRRR